MLTLLNILLLCVATGATLAAFGGDTWDKDKKTHAFQKRVTLRGWISLLCLVGALLLGVIKELETRAEARRKDEVVAREKLAGEAAAVVKEQALTHELEDARRSLAGARQELGEVVSALHVVKGNLDSARSDLSKANTMNLISVLAASQQTIEEIWVWIPSERKFGDEKELKRAVALGLGDSHCPLRDDNRVSIQLWLPPENMVIPGGTTPDVFGLIVNSDDRELVIDRQTAKTSFRKLGTLMEEEHLETFFAERLKAKDDRTITAASYYSYIADRGSPLNFIYEVEDSKCAPSMASHRFSVFEKVVLILVLDKVRNVTLTFVLKPEPVKYYADAKWLVVSFKVSSGPNFMALPFREYMDDIEKQLDARER